MTIVGRAELDFVDLPGRRSANPLISIPSEASVRVVELERTDDRTAHRHPARGKPGSTANGIP